MCNPGLCLVPSLVQGKETSLSTTLDELIGLRDELGVEHPAWKFGVGGDGIGLRVP